MALLARYSEGATGKDHIIATLQGALILTKNLSVIEVFDRIVEDLQNAL